MKFFKKWYTYQKERFPVLIYGLYIFCIVFAVFCFSNYLAPLTYDTMNNLVWSAGIEEYSINYLKLIPMFVVAFLQFLMVRIVDEFKDYEEDCKYRPYRPVPRGLISLKELKILFIICIIMQLGVTLIFNPKGIILLGLVWIIFWFLSKDFFIKEIIDKHILVGVFFDELLLPALVLYLARFVYIIDYKNIWPLLLISYLISWIVEVARKIRCKEDEEAGVKTYTAVFGIKKAIMILFILETLLMILHLKVLGIKHLIWIIGIYIFVNIINLLFIKKKSKKNAKMTELSANIYIMVVYLSMALLII